VTPFNKSGAKRYDDLLRDRNLLVHHGGVFTFAYLEQTSLHPSNLNLQSDAFTNSRIVGRAEVIAAVEFIENVADKLVRGSHAALVRYLEANNIQYSGERKKALDLISYSRKTGDDAAK
jgi:hypothetical protein